MKTTCIARHRPTGSARHARSLNCDVETDNNMPGQLVGRSPSTIVNGQENAQIQ